MENQKVAIVTGGSRGIGRAIACELAADGYYVVITYKLNDMRAQETVSMITDKCGKAEAVKFDVADAEEAAVHMQSLCSRFQNIQALINNAGITADGLFMLMTEADWNTVIDTSLKGFYHVTQPVLKKMAVNHSGSIISISSVSALMGNRGQSNYSAAKAGIIAASKALACEVARSGIRVNVVAPGLINTEMISDVPVMKIKEIIPMARIGNPEEVAKVVRFLCSDDASYVTGQVISVNGGMF